MDLIALADAVERMVAGDMGVSLPIDVGDMVVDKVLERAPFLPNIHLRHFYSNLCVSFTIIR